mgnify:FL=1
MIGLRYEKPEGDDVVFKGCGLDATHNGSVRNPGCGREGRCRGMPRFRRTCDGPAGFSR